MDTARMPNEKWLAAALRDLRSLLDQPLPRLDQINELVRVAEALCPADGLDAVLQTVQLAIEGLPRDRREIALQLYGLIGESRGKRLKDRRRLAYQAYRAVTAGRSDIHSEETFRTKDEPLIAKELATILVRLAQEHNVEATSEPSALTAGERPAALLSAQNLRSRMRYLRHPVALTLLGTLLVVGLMTLVAEESQPDPARVELRHLAEETTRNLTGQEAPEPGESSRILGFGDPLQAGRHKYWLRELVKRGRSAKPTLDSLLIDRPGVLYFDERRFLRVEASPTRDARQLTASFKHVVAASAHSVVWLTVLVHNDMLPVEYCTPTDAGIVTGTHLMVSIWNSPNNRLHIIRAWVTADETEATWITDAVAVLTGEGVTLEPDSTLSRELATNLNPHNLSSNTFATEPLINVESLLVPPGLLVGEEGVVGTCEDNNAYFVIIALRQTG